MAEVIKTLKAGDGDYATLNEFASDAQDLVAAGDNWLLEVYDEFPGGLLTNADFAGWTTDAANNITIRAAAGQGHGGVMGAGTVFYNSSNTVIQVVSLGAQHITLENVSFEQRGTANANGCIASSRAGSYVFNNCFIMCTGSHSGNGMRRSSGGDGGLEAIFTNCVFYSEQGLAYGLWSEEFSSPVTLQNCTFIGWNEAIRTTGDSAKCINTVCFGNTVDFAQAGGDDAGSTNNASEDSTAPGANPITSITSAAFEDYAGGNFMPAGAGVLDGAGIDNSAAGYTTDIAGTERG